MEILTDDVVTKRILDELAKIIGVLDKHFHQLAPLFNGTESQALFHDVACKFVFGKQKQMLLDQIDHPATIIRTTVFHHILSDVVAKLIRNDGLGNRVKFVKDTPLRRLNGMLEEALNNTTSELVFGKYENPWMNSVENGLHPLRIEALDRALDDMVAVLMLGQFLDPRFQLSSEFILLIAQDMRQCMLNYSAGVHLCRQSIHLGLQLVGQGSLLSLVTVIEQFLNDPIAEEILSQLHSFRQYFLKEFFFLVAVGRFYSALNEA